MALNFANNNSLSAISAKPSGLSGGAMNLISTQTASGSANLSFTSGIDDTYDSYVFKFYNIHPATDGQIFYVNFRDGGTAYDAVKTTTFFDAFHQEDDGGTPNVAYASAADLAQSTANQRVAVNVGNGNDENTSGQLTIFSPSSTVFVKHFICTMNNTRDNNQTVNSFMAGYCNVTAAIDGVQFVFGSGNIDSGVIKLYGIS